MTRNEWLDTLRETLQAEVPQNEIDNNIIYYRDYIDRESQNQQEMQVLQTLGEPRLIAKTIIETYKMQRGSEGYNAYDEQNNYDYSDTFQRNRSSDYDTVDESGNVEKNGRYYKVGHIKWYHKVIFFAILALIIVLLVIIGGFVLKLFFTIGLPVLCIVLLYRLIRRK